MDCHSERSEESLHKNKTPTRRWGFVFILQSFPLIFEVPLATFR